MLCGFFSPFNVVLRGFLNWGHDANQMVVQNGDVPGQMK